MRKKIFWFYNFFDLIQSYYIVFKQFKFMFNYKSVNHIYLGWNILYNFFLILMNKNFLWYFITEKQLKGICSIPLNK